MIVSPAGFRLAFYLLFGFWFFCTAAAWWAIRRRNIKAHRQFMVRSYTAALAFVFIRIFSLLGYDRFFPFLDTLTEKRITGEWLCWVVPFLIIEIYMVWWPVLSLKQIPAKK